jgi:hypothetical protein
MNDRNLAEELATTLQQVETLLEIHQDGLDYAAAQERLTWMHQQTKATYQALLICKQRAFSDERSPHATQGQEIWRKICRELRSLEPEGIQAPARTVVDSHVDMLKLVAYIVHMYDVFQEQTKWLSGQMPVPPVSEDSSKVFLK